MIDILICDPAVCDCCQYIGEGDFLCDKNMVLVVDEWEPTENYLQCLREESE